MKRVPEESPGPLSGLRIIELGSLIAGPFATRLLADYGAQVIKIEAPNTPDPMRDWGHVTYKDKHLWWSVQARNKDLITLNLRHPRGQEVFLEMVSKADAVVENFRPGTMEKWGLGWEKLEQTNPRLIMVRVSGFGQTGPYRHRAGFGSVAESMGGLRYLNGFPDRPPHRFGISLGDALASLYAVIGCLSAVEARHRTGKGQMVDCAISEAVLSLLESAVPEYGLTGYVRERQGNVLPGIVPSNTYATRDGQFIVIGANQDRIFKRLAKVMRRPELADDPRYQDHLARGAHQEELDRIIEEWTRAEDLETLTRQLNDSGIPAGPIYSIREIFNDPHYKAREMVLDCEDPTLGRVPVPGIVPKFSDTPGAVRHLGKWRTGTDNRKIYGQLLNMSNQTLEELEKTGAI